MAEQNKSENVDLSGIGPNAATEASATNSEEQLVNQMDGHTTDLSSSVAPGMTAEELVQTILQTPEEKLIPWEECVLPSRGNYYGWSSGVMMVRAMGQVAEKVLATQRLHQDGQAIDYLFRQCCKFPDGFASEDLLIGDRTFLLYYIRGITHGNMYEFAINCPNPDCEQTSTHTYDLNELSRTIVWAKPSLGSEPFKVILPHLSKIFGREIYVSLRFLRGHHASEVLARRRANKRMFARPGGTRTRGRTPGGVNPNQQRAQLQQLDDSLTENMEKMIVDVNGVGNAFTIRQFIEKLHAQDTAAIREWLRDNTPGIDATITVQCPSCNQEFTMELPITESFFRPSKPR